MKNYYTLLQIAHAINQFVEKSKAVKELLKRHSKETLKNIWGNITAYMQFQEVRQPALSPPFTNDNQTRIPHPS
jgi:ribosomal protein S17E